MKVLLWYPSLVQLVFCMFFPTHHPLNMDSLTGNVSVFHLSFSTHAVFLTKKMLGIFTVTSWDANKSWTLKPLWAITESLGSHLLIREPLSTICLSLVEPPYAGDMYDTIPPGVAPTKIFTVFRFCMWRRSLLWFRVWRLLYWALLRSLSDGNTCPPLLEHPGHTTCARHINKDLFTIFAVH